MTPKELKESELVELPFKDGVSVFMYFKNDRYFKLTKI